MAIKKTQLYSALWASCDELRGGMDASEYKDYILTLLFVKYVSDRFKGDPYAEIQIPENGSFDTLVAAKNASDIGEKINKAIAALANANPILSGVINIADFDDDSKLGKGNEKVERLTNLIAIFEDPSLNFRSNRAGGDDILGDAYEYLMRNFAVESGRSKGQFYTPAEVSRIIAKIIGAGAAKTADTTVYDPACGSGSLLIRASDEAPYGLTIYGQEKEPKTTGLAKMNLVLHNKSTGTIKAGNTFTDPYEDGEGVRRFDFVVANPPFSDKKWMTGLKHAERFKDFDDMPPKKNGDFAWLIHVLRSMKSEGKGAIILPHGVLFRGNAEALIRKNIIENRKGIKGIIGLPTNLFYGTGIPACIIVFDKENADTRTGIYIIDASHDFIKDGNKNRLRERDIKKIVDFFTTLREDEPSYARFVKYAEIEANGYNLNILRYIKSGAKEDIQDIPGHIYGGIPQADVDALSDYWKAFDGLREALFSNFGRERYLKLTVDKSAIWDTIFHVPSYLAYAEKLDNAYTAWKTTNNDALYNIPRGTNPKEFILPMAQSMLDLFCGISLVDQYDAYEALMVYWNEVMQDDVYIISSDGYEAGREVEKEFTKPKKGEPKLKSFEGKIIPKRLVVDMFFPEERDAIAKLERALEDVQSKMTEMFEEESGEEGFFIDLLNEKKDDVKADELKKRISEIKGSEDDSEEYGLLVKYQKLHDLESKVKKTIKDAQTALDETVLAKYPTLTITEIKVLLVEKKWSWDIYTKIDAIYRALSHHLSARLIELAERYERTMPDLAKEVEEIEKKVKSHLERMGFVW